MLRKMKDVFRVFWENQEEVALLWRPHPLIKATIESMRPQLWEEYEQLVKEYRSAGWGIYDDGGPGPGHCGVRRVLWRPQLGGEAVQRGGEADYDAECGNLQRFRR